MFYMKKYLLIVLITLFLTSCGQSGAPVIVMFGSYFPSWIFYFIFGVIITILLRVLFIKIGFDNLIEYKLLFYISLMLILAFLSSLLFF